MELFRSNLFARVAILLLSALVVASQDVENASSGEVYCYACDDSDGYCGDPLEKKLCGASQPACMMEVFFRSSSQAQFSYRASCADILTCPPGVTDMMCSQYPGWDGFCRICCHGNNCVDPRRTSGVSQKAMKRILSNVGIDGAAAEDVITRAVNRGSTGAWYPPTKDVWRDTEDVNEPMYLTGPTSIVNKVEEEEFAERKSGRFSETKIKRKSEQASKAPNSALVNFISVLSLCYILQVICYLA